MKKHPRYDEIKAAFETVLSWIPEAYGLVLLDKRGRELFFVGTVQSSAHREAFFLAMIARDLLIDIEVIREQLSSVLEMIIVRYMPDKVMWDDTYPDPGYVVIMPVADLAYLFVPLQDQPGFGYHLTLEKLRDDLQEILEAGA